MGAIYLNGISYGGGGGSGGTTTYNQLPDKPQINSVELSGDKSAEDLGLADADDVLLKDGSVAASKLTVGARMGSAPLGNYAFENGAGVLASGAMSHAEGIQTQATAQTAHAEGMNTRATGNYSHAEGNSAYATAAASHAEGQSTEANGNCSHAEGYFTEAGYYYQHVSGMYNDNKENTLFEIGNGADASHRSNAFEVYRDGHINVNGDIYKNGVPFSGGDASLEADVTSNLAVGAITSGTTFEEGTTFTEFVQKLLITEIAPTITFTATESGVHEVGSRVYLPELTLTITSKGTGTPVSIEWYKDQTLLYRENYEEGVDTYSYETNDITQNTTVKGVLNYKKSDNTNATVEKSASYTFVMASYYGAVTTAPTDKAGIIALTKVVKTTKEQTTTFTLNNQRSCYYYPASFGDLTSIKDINNLEYLSSYTKTNVTVDGILYNVYTLTDPVTATEFKQVYT